MPGYRSILSRRLFTAVLACGIAILASCVTKEDKPVPVAVAANFTEPAKEIAQLFEQTENHKAVLSFGSTGQLFTQITQDAPFEVFLAADHETPMKIVEANLADANSTFTYAIGKIVLFSTTKDLSQGEAVLRE